MEEQVTLNEEEVGARVPDSETRRAQSELNHKMGLNPYDLYIFRHIAQRKKESVAIE